MDTSRSAHGQKLVIGAKWKLYAVGGLGRVGPGTIIGCGLTGAVPPQSRW